jgi:hypothetical protein
MNDKQNEQIKFATVKELTRIHPSFSEASLRYWIFKAKQNGLDHCLRRLGRKILINVSEFEAWIDGHKFDEEK